MKNNRWLELAKKVIEQELDFAEKYYKSEVAPLMELGSPEAVIGKKFEQWTARDAMYAKAIFGGKLDEFIAKKQYKQLLLEEKELV